MSLSKRPKQSPSAVSYIHEYDDFVCVDAMGMLLQPDFVSQKFQKILGLYGLRSIRFHDLRHSCATIMLYLGYTMKDIQTWLGHSNYSFTANTYVHSSKDSHVQMAQAFAEKLPELNASVVDIVTAKSQLSLDLSSQNCIH